MTVPSKDDSQSILSDALFYDVYTNLAELHLSNVGINVTWSDVSLEQEQSDLFTDVTMNLETYKARTPVYISVGMTHIKITAARSQDIAPGLACKSSEIVLLTVKVANKFSISCRNSASAASASVGGSSSSSTAVLLPQI